MGIVAAAAVARVARLVRCAQAHARQRRIYARLLRKHGGWRAEAPHEVHHWGSAQQQARRFEVILEMAGPRQLRNASVADIGCGCGDLLAFLRRSGATPREYVGYDIVPEMVAEAQRRFGADERVSFECRDVALRPPNRTFDFVLSSGIFAFGNREFFEQMASASFDMAETAYIFNLFEGKGYEQDFWSAPRHEMIGFCKKLSLEACPDEIEQPIAVRDDYLSDRSDSTFMINKR